MAQQKATESIASGDSGGAEVLPFGLELGGRYEIREFLGVGGYATVYRAWDRELKREIALKILRNDRRSPAALTRFRREAIVAREVASPHLLKIFDIAATDEGCYLTMELVRGESLRQRIARGTLSVEEAVGIALQILEGLQALHTLHIVHRDLKPENVLIAEDGTVKVADFGLARLLDEEFSRATATGALVGTTDYIPPEQALGTAVDARADLYALGIVLFEMLTGGLPFVRDSSIGAVLARLRARAPSVRSRNQHVPLWLASIIGRLLEKDPRSRYASAEDAARALRARRIDVFRYLRPALFAVPLLLAILGGWFFIRPAAQPQQFVRLARVGDRGIEAIGRDGRVLWERTNVDPEIASKYALARLQRGGKPLIATILGARDDFSLQRMETLSFLDPLSGNVVRRVHIPSASDNFPHDPRRYEVRSVNAVDLTGDGVDEVIICFEHVPEAPSYTVLYEPGLDRSRILFIGYGVHDFAGVHDVDGDGKPEVLLLGINNGFDWFNALAAVRIRPWIGEMTRVEDQVPSSPDMPTAEDSNLLWYTLLPRGGIPYGATRYVSFDDRHRRITVRLQTGRTIAVSYDGFISPSSLPTAQRQDARRSAYLDYRESHRLFDANFPSESIAVAQRSVREAAVAQDAILGEAMQRSLGQLLIRTGQVDRGVSLLQSLASTSENASDIAYEIAAALHLHGDVARAIDWYRRGAGRGGALTGGKDKHEFLQGIVLGLCELGKCTDAIPDFLHFQSAYSWRPSDQTALFLQFIRWRSGQRPNLDGISIPPKPTDLTRYWVLEFRNANDEPPGPLLKATNDLIAVGDDPPCVLWSLKAELLWRLGRRGEALAAIRRAEDLLASERLRSIVARSHAAIIDQRYKQITKEQI